MNDSKNELDLSLFAWIDEGGKIVSEPIIDAKTITKEQFLTALGDTIGESLTRVTELPGPIKSMMASIGLNMDGLAMSFSSIAESAWEKL